MLIHTLGERKGTVLTQIFDTPWPSSRWCGEVVGGRDNNVLQGISVGFAAKGFYAL